MKKHYQENFVVTHLEEMINHYNNDEVVVDVLANVWDYVTNIVNPKKWIESSYNSNYLIREKLTKEENDLIFKRLWEAADELWERYRDHNIGEAYSAYGDLQTIRTLLMII